MIPQDILFDENTELKMHLAAALSEVSLKSERIVLYEEENNRLHEIIADFKRHRFGKRSETYVSVEQLVFDEAEALASQAKAEESEAALGAEVEVPAHKRKRGHRKPLPIDLPREIVVIELPESERVGENGEVLKPIGKEVSEKLHFEPAILKVIETHRIRYGADSGDTGVIAPVAPSILPKSMATPGLLANIVLQKYGYGVPLYRQEEMYMRMGCDIPRCTQARWVIQAAEACLAIKNVLTDRLMAVDYVSCDETHTQVLDEKGRKAETKSWMWVRTTPSEEKKIVLFDYYQNRSGEVAKELFADYRGVLQVDGFSSYNALEKQDGIKRIGCNMHGRRKFEAAFKNGAKIGTKNKESLAETALKFYKKLYDVETKCRSLSFEERSRVRQNESAPLWEEFKNWADVNSKKVPPKSKIGQAFHYFLGEYQYLVGYLDNGRLEMDNGFAERAIAKFAIGRKNWLFSIGEAGAEASSFFYSLVVTAKINGGDPYEILKRVFEMIPLAETADDIDRIADLILAGPILH
jgi:transposase